MNIGLYQGAASLSALERWQDVVTQNITSSQVSGFKKRTIEFSAIPFGEMQTNPKGRVGEGNGTPTLFPSTKFGINYQIGESFPTGRPLDVALNSEGFLMIQQPDGQRAYTRAGDLHIRPDRTLVSGSGNPFLTDRGNPIVLQPQGGDITITQDGTVLQGGNPLGKLGVVDFPDKSVLHPIAGGVFSVPEGVEGVPVAQPILMQGQLESSNVTPLREMVALVQIARAYEANQKVISTQDQTLAKALETLG